MIACNKCRNQISDNVPYVTQAVVGGMRLDWHLQCYNVAQEKPADERK
jgi:hypothetical protein